MEAQHHAKTANAGITKCVLPCSWIGISLNMEIASPTFSKTMRSGRIDLTQGLVAVSIADITLVHDNATVVCTRQGKSIRPRTRGRLRQASHRSRAMDDRSGLLRHGRPRVLQPHHRQPKLLRPPLLQL